MTKLSIVPKVKELIKYKNRKIYSVNDCRYTSHKEILSWIQDGYQIICKSKTKKRDYTVDLLMSIIKDVGTSQKRKINKNVLHHILASTKTEKLFKFIEEPKEIKKNAA